MRPIKTKEEALKKVYCTNNPLIYIPKVLRNVKIKFIEVENGK